MKSFFSQEIYSCIPKWFLLLAIFFQTIHHGFAQDSTRPVYFTFAYIKTKPGKEEAFKELLANYSRAFFKQQVKDGNLLGWFVFQVLMPSGSQAEYNFVGITATRDIKAVFEPIMTTNREYFKKVFPRLDEKKVNEVIAQYHDARDIVKREVYTNYAVAAPMRARPYNYMWWSFHQPLPGKLVESLQWEKNNWTEIHKASIEMGGMDNWAVYTLNMPRSLNEQYQYMTINFFDDLSQYQANFKYNEAIKKAAPDMDFTKIFQMPGGQKKVYRSEVIKLVTYVNGSNVNE